MKPTLGMKSTWEGNSFGLLRPICNLLTASNDARTHVEAFVSPIPAVTVDLTAVQQQRDTTLLIGQGGRHTARTVRKQLVDRIGLAKNAIFTSSD